MRGWPREHAAAASPLWRSLLSALYLELMGGGVYAFGVYAPLLRSRFGYSQAQVQLVGTVGNVGAWLLLPAGYSFDRHGPVTGIFVGSGLVFSGYLLLWGIVSGRVGGAAQYALLLVGAFAAQHGCGWWDGTAVPMASRNFPHDRGLAVGLIKGFFGISSSVITLLFQSFFRPDIAKFMLSLALGLPAGAMAAALGATLSKGSAAPPLNLEERARVVAIGYGLLALLVVYISCSSLSQKQRNRPVLGYLLMPLLASFFALLWPIRARWMERILAGGSSDAGGGGRDQVSAASLLRSRGKASASDDGGDGGNGDRSGARGVAPPPPLPISARLAPTAGSRVSAFEEVLRERNFWLIFSICFIGMGSGITLINNIGGLVLSLGGAPGTQDTYVVLISVGSCVGRAGAGLASVQLRRWPRARFLLANCLLMALAQLSLCIPSLSKFTDALFSLTF